MQNENEPIKAAPTARTQTEIDGMKNILEDALYEMGCDDTLVDILLERNIIDFDTVSYTSHIKYQLEEHYGESVLWDDLEDAVACEGLDISLTGELGEIWRASKGETFRERIRDIIEPLIEKLGLKAILRYDLMKGATLSGELEGVKRHLTIDYGESNSILPYIDIVIYNPENLLVVAVISCEVNLKNRVISMAYWRFKLQADERTTDIKYYLITTDIDGTLKIADVPQTGRVMIEADLDCTYVLTSEDVEESAKVKLFEHFIEDFKKAIDENR